MANTDSQPARRSGAVPAFPRIQELTKFNVRSFCNTRTGLFSTVRPATSETAKRCHHHDVVALRTGKRLYTTVPSEADQELERRRRAVLCAYGTASGLFRPPYAPSAAALDRTIRRHADGGGAQRLAGMLRHENTTKLLRSPTAHHPGVKSAIASCSRWPTRRDDLPLLLRRVPSSTVTSVDVRCSDSVGATTSPDASVPSQLPPQPTATEAEVDGRGCPELVSHCAGSGPGGVQCSSGSEDRENPQDTITQVAVAPIGDPCLSDPMQDYEITMTDLLTVFTELDAAHTGAVPLADFEAAMLRLGYAPDAASRLFAALDANGDGVLTFADWSSEPSRRAARALTHRFLRHRVIGNDPVRAQRPPSSLTDQKRAMEMLLVDLGVTAKSNFIKVKGLFDAMDTDGSGDISSDELTLTVERILRQKISKGVKAQLLQRFDRNGDGVVSSTEFLNKVVANPMATLYAFMPSNVCLS
eukprot:jgi/Ulvmu1/2376/UM130_0009.1